MESTGSPNWSPAVTLRCLGETSGLRFEVPEDLMALLTELSERGAFLSLILLNMKGGRIELIGVQVRKVIK